MVNVVSLALHETAIVDLSKVEDVWRQKGEAEAHRVIGAELDRLAEQMSRIGMAYREGRFDIVVAGCRDAAETAGTVGLDRLGRVACTVATLAGGRDATALAANIGRLMRLGDGALGKIWELQDRRM